MKYIFSSLCITMLLLIPSLVRSQSIPVTLDGRFEDWSEGLAAIIEEANAVSGVDLLEMQAGNDDEFLYIRIRANMEFDLLEPLIAQNIFLHLDTDNDETTGYEVQTGFGAELSIELSQRRAWFYTGSTSQLNLSAVSFRASPTVTGDEFELAIHRDAVPDGSQALFPSSRIRVLWENRLNGDKLPSPGKEFLYSFDETSVPAPEPTEITKKDASHIRILAYNTRRNGLNNEGILPYFENIVKVLDPDIIGFSECSETATSYVKGLLDEWLPLESSEGWYVTTYSWGDLITASRWPIIETVTSLDRQMPTLIDLPETYPTDLLFTNSHLKCCDGDDQRQGQVDAYISFLLDAKTSDGNYKLEDGTPFIYAGDLNLVGYARQLSTLIEGDIQNTIPFGQGGPPDWDDTDVTDLVSLQTGTRMDYTWRNDYSSYPPGKLDFMIYSDAVLQVENNYVLRTETMSEERLALYGLMENATSLASDHYPVIADFSILTDPTGLAPRAALQHKIHPNPASNLLHISFGEEGSYRIRIIDIEGRAVFDGELSSSSPGIDISMLPEGVYFIRILDEHGPGESHKLIKH